jgi:hypothetical protein
MRRLAGLAILSLCLSGCAGMEYHHNPNAWNAMQQFVDQTTQQPAQAPQKRINMTCQNQCMNRYFDYAFCVNQCSY